MSDIDESGSGSENEATVEKCGQPCMEVEGSKSGAPECPRLCVREKDHMYDHTCGRSPHTGTKVE